MGISTAGIGSGLDVEGIITKLMTVEAAPLQTFDKKAASFQAKVSAIGSLSGAIGAFQGSLASLTSISNFQSMSSVSNNTDVMVGSATSKAVPGIYSVNVTQLSQAQTLASLGRVSTTAPIGLGLATTLSFQLGKVSGGSFGSAGGALGAGVASGGIANGALVINGVAIATDSSTKSAKALADAINAKNATSGVSATAVAAQTSATLFGAGAATTFGDVDTSGGGTYSLTVNGVQIAAQPANALPAAVVSAASIDATLAGSNSTTAALAAANITFTGSAADGTLRFSSSDGANLTVTEAVSGAVLGGLGTSAVNAGSSVTTSGSVTLASTDASPVTIGGSNPQLAGFAAGVSGSYSGAGFAQDPNQVSGTVLIDSTNNSLQGIRDAINKAKVGVTATIVSDGSATPYHLVLTSTKTGASSTMKIALSGDNGGAADADLQALLGYDPAGVQALTQNTAAQSTLLNVNGIPVSSETNTIADAIQGVSLTVGAVGKAKLTVKEDTSALKGGINAFVKAFNDLNKSIKSVSGYDADTKKAGVLLGDSTVQNLQSQLRKQLTLGITGLTGGLSRLSDVGITFQKDGTLSLDGGKLDKAISNNLSDIAGLFAAVGKASDSLVGFSTSTAATTPGDYALNITALAKQGSLVGDTALGPTTVIAANTKWSVTLHQTEPVTGDRTATVSLAAGSYTPAQLATLVQSAINGAGTYASSGLSVNATIDADGKLNLVSAKYGSVSKIAVTGLSGTPTAALFGAAVPVAGNDIAGTLGGQPAVGSGQFLTGSPGSPADGLKVEVTGGEIGERGTVGFSQGYAYQLNNLAATFLGAKGLLQGRTDGLNATIKTITKQRDNFNDSLADIEKRYRKQYTALDTAISSMSSTASFLTQQFAAMAKQTS
ncbi:MAG: flagellar filament capping protein FliD [Massilia sp.]